MHEFAINPFHDITYLQFELSGISNEKWWPRMHKSLSAFRNEIGPTASLWGMRPLPPSGNVSV